MSFNDNFAASLCSMWEIMKFSVKCGGYWVKNHRGEVGYIGGEVMTINCKSEELFNALAEEFGEGLCFETFFNFFF